MINAPLFTSMLIAAAPLLIVYLIALVMSIIFWNDHPQTCALVLGGALILLLVTFIQPILQQQLFNSNRSAGRPISSYAQLISVIGIVANIFKAGGIGLFVWAAFAGRTSANTPPSAFPTLPPRVPGPPFGQQR